MHRVGRTGRGTKKGNAVSFCSDEEKPLLKQIEKFLDNPIKVMDVKGEDYKDTMLFTEDTNDNWKLLMREAEKAQNQKVFKKPGKKHKKK